MYGSHIAVLVGHERAVDILGQLPKDLKAVWEDA